MTQTLVLLMLLPLAARAESPVPDRAALEKRAAAAESTGDGSSALAAALELDALAEAEHAETLYRVARLHALLGHDDEASEALERLAPAALFDVGRIRRDEAFATMREDERFKNAVRAV
jgi:hypothetical protein